MVLYIQNILTNEKYRLIFLTYNICFMTFFLLHTPRWYWIVSEQIRPLFMLKRSGSWFCIYTPAFVFSIVILISFTNLCGTPNLSRILQSFSLSRESYACLMSMKIWQTSMLYSHAFLRFSLMSTSQIR